MSTKLKIYVDTGANIRDLHKQKPNELKKLEFIRFPHDGNIQRFDQAAPSIPTWGDWNQPWSLRVGSWEGIKPSSKFFQINKILGQNARKDALHLDSAYKSNASAFLTNDIHDIVKNRSELEDLLEYRIFLFSDKKKTELTEFLDYMKRRTD